MPLDRREMAMVLQAVSGIMGCHYLIPFNSSYSPALPNYSGSAWGEDLSVVRRVPHQRGVLHR